MGTPSRIPDARAAGPLQYQESSGGHGPPSPFAAPFRAATRRHAMIVSTRGRTPVAALLCGFALAMARADEPASSDAAKTGYASAAALQNREAWDLAAEEWQTLLTAHPQDPLALKGRYYLAICQLKAGDWPAAARTLEAVVASKADAVTVALARWELGRGAFEAAQKQPAAAAYAAAADRLQDFLAKSPGQPQAADATHFLGEALWQAGKRDEAIATWQRFIKDHAASPRTPEVLYALGVGQAETGRPKEAAAILDRFAQEFPGHALAADVALWRADLATAAGRPTDAEKILVPLFSTASPRAAEALDRLGNARWNQKNWAGAAEAYGRLVAEHGKSPLAAKARVAAGRALVEAGRPDDARRLLEQAASGPGPEAIDAAHHLAVLELAAKRPAAALDVATRALAAAAGRPGVDPAFVPKLELDRADALWDIPARRAEATAAYAALADKHPQSPAAATALSMTALALLEAKQPAEALARADAYLAGHARQAAAEAVLDVRAIRAECLLALGKHADAAKAFDELVASQAPAERRSAWQLRQAAALAADRQWKPAHESAAKAAAGLRGDQRAEALLLDASTLVELKQPADAARLLAEIDTSLPSWSRRDEALLLRVRALREAGDKAGALAVGERLVKEFPTGAGADVAWYRLGQLRQDAGKPDEAIAAFAQAVKIAPAGSRAPWALLATGWCHEAQGRLPDAIQAWTTLIDKHPQSAAAASGLLARSDVRQRTGDAAGGLADARRLLQEARDGKTKLDAAALGEARLLEGLCLAGAKNYAQAAAAFGRLLQEQPQFAAADRALFELAVVQSLDGKGADAAATFLSLAEKFPGSPYAAEAWLEVGESRWAAKRYDEAAKAYTSAVAAAGKGSGRMALVAEQARHKLGWSHAMRGDHAAAARAFAEQLAAAPQGGFAADAQAMLGESLLAQGKAAEAAAAFARALAEPLGLSSAELRDAAFLRAAEAAARQEKWDESLAIAERFLAAAPQSPQAPQGRYAAAWARQNLGRLDEALAGYRAVADGPRTEVACRARLMEGEVLFEQEHHKEAIKAFFKAAYGFGEQQAPPAFHPWQAQATYEAARCFEVLAQPDQARRLYAELVARYPESQQIPSARKRLEALGPPPGDRTP
jgi:TolA-binding protein